MEIPVVSVVTNEHEDLQQWLKCVQNLRSNRVKPIACVADNASSDGTSGVLWKAIKDGVIDKENIFWLPANRGFASAQNHVFRQLGARKRYKYVATLNIDATAKADWLGRLVKVAEEAPKKCGMWGGPIRQPKPKDSRLSSAGHALRRRDGAFLDIDRDCDVKGEGESKSKGFEPFCPCFAAALWSFELLAEAGLSDNDQFLYYDDVDIAYKARILGWSAGFVADAVAWHPLPNRKFTHDRQRQYQIEGRLCMVARYFPDSERLRVYADLPQREREILDSLDSRRRVPFRDDPTREEIFSKWGDLHIPPRKRY
jgi:GT2 family glycosyltransferase